MPALLFNELNHQLAHLNDSHNYIDDHYSNKHADKAPASFIHDLLRCAERTAEQEHVQGRDQRQNLIHHQLVVVNGQGKGLHYHKVGEEGKVLAGEGMDLHALVVFEKGEHDWDKEAPKQEEQVEEGWEAGIEAKVLEEDWE